MLNNGLQVVVSDDGSGRHAENVLEVQEAVNVCCTYEEHNRPCCILPRKILVVGSVEEKVLHLIL